MPAGIGYGQPPAAPPGMPPQQALPPQAPPMGGGPQAMPPMGQPPMGQPPQGQGAPPPTGAMDPQQQMAMAQMLRSGQ